MSQHKITVGIPFYHKTRFKDLKLSVDSILKQTFKNVTLHLIQNGEVNKKILDLINNYDMKYENIFHIKVKEVGLSKALNNSIKMTRTKYYARMDADDIALNNRLKYQYEFMENNQDISILGSWAIEFLENKDSQNNFIKRMPSCPNKIIEYFHYRNPLIHSTVMFRLSVFDMIGYYNEKFSSDQDLELWGRAIKSKIGIFNIQKPLLYYNTRGIHKRRTKLSAIYNQIKVRQSMPASTLKLKLFKFLSICFRLMPKRIIKFGYRTLR